MGAGVAGYDPAHVLCGTMLVLSFALLTRRRVGAAINLYGLQAAVLAAAAAYRAYVFDFADLYLTAILTLAAKGVALPLGLHAVVRRLQKSRAVAPAAEVFGSLVMGVGAVALAAVAVLPVSRTAGTMGPEHLATALSVMLLGLLIMISRRPALMRVLGFLLLENGVILAGTGIPGMPFLPELSIASMLLLALLVFGVLLLRAREGFDSLDLAQSIRTHFGQR